MNALVASVIRTLVPVIVGQVAAWLLLLNVTLPTAALDGLNAFLGGVLTAIYYVGVRVLEQQWPAFGALLGLVSSPDTYSKGNDTPAEASKQTSLAATSTVIDLTNSAPASTFPKAAVDAAEATAAPVVPDFGTPVATPPVVTPAA